MSDGAPIDPPRVITARLDEASQGLLDALRSAHFPPERLMVGAHLTLFHAIPAQHAQRCMRHLEALGAQTPRLPASMPSLRLMGRGVAVMVTCPPLVVLHDRLRAALRPWLTAQDDQRLWPHVTIANKLSPAQARRVHGEVQATWVPREGSITGLSVWRYLGGPWEHERDVTWTAPPMS